MPIYKISQTDSVAVVAVKANTKAQALNYVMAGRFSAEPMKAEEVMAFMENGGKIDTATEAPVVQQDRVDEGSGVSFSTEGATTPEEAA